VSIPLGLGGIMFTTDSLDEVCQGSVSMLSGDTKHWKRLSVASPFFQIAGSPNLIGAEEDEALLIADPYDLARLAAAMRRVYNSELGEVIISTPHSINGCGKWLHQTLYAMFFVLHRSTGKNGFVYFTSGGTYGIADESELSYYAKEVLYQSQHHPLNIFDDYIDTHRIKD
jgi:hypothetical protein